MSSAASPVRGRLFVIAAPSGAGKTSLVRALMGREPGLRFSISYTTRTAVDMKVLIEQMREQVQNVE